MRKYELMLIINPELQETDRAALIDDIKDELKTANVKISSEDIWWTKDLAYKINGSKTGFYILLQIESEGDKFFEVTKNFNIKKDLWRHMFIKQED